jgi:hypothetical protein
MGRASSSKKVSRAAGTGGGRTAGRNRPLGWYAAIALVVVLGFTGIFFSRNERRTELASGSDLTPPVANKDHWHAAYGVYLCDEFAPAITDQRDPYGIHTHGDGVIHIHPFVRSAAGKNATLGKFMDTVKATLTDSKLQLPGGKAYVEDKTKCSGKPGIVQVAVNGKVNTVGLRAIRLKDRDLVTIAFAPAGAKLPEPPSAGQLDKLEDVAPATTPTTAAGDAGATDTSTTAPQESSTTTAKP